MKKMEMVYIEHAGGTAGRKRVKAVDRFVRSASDLTKEECDKAYKIDYYMPDCRYVMRFLEIHPEYKYVGSTDSGHGFGYAMNLDRFKKVHTPEVD